MCCQDGSKMALIAVICTPIGIQSPPSIRKRTCYLLVWEAGVEKANAVIGRDCFLHKNGVWELSIAHTCTSHSSNKNL